MPDQILWGRCGRRQLAPCPDRCYSKGGLLQFMRGAPPEPPPELGAGGGQGPLPADVTMSLPGTVSAGIAYALDLLRSRYEGNSDPDDDMPFHCAEHTAG